MSSSCASRHVWLRCDFSLESTLPPRRRARPGACRAGDCHRRRDQHRVRADAEHAWARRRAAEPGAGRRDGAGPLARPPGRRWFAGCRLAAVPPPATRRACGDRAAPGDGRRRLAQGPRRGGGAGELGARLRPLALARHVPRDLRRASAGSDCPWRALAGGGRRAPPRCRHARSVHLARRRPAALVPGRWRGRGLPPATLLLAGGSAGTDEAMGDLPRPDRARPSPRARTRRGCGKRGRSTSRASPACTASTWATKRSSPPGRWTSARRRARRCARPSGASHGMGIAPSCRT